MVSAPTASLALVLVLAGARAAPQADDPFHLWYDGQAEVNGYRWEGARYGERRTGEAVAIFVTEPMDPRTHVKIDRPEAHRGEALTVLKLNLVRDFQTGLYDYDTMVSVFVDAESLRPVKQSFTSTEWCGNVYEELDVRGKSLALDVRSYFEGESTEIELPMRADGVVGDHLLVWLRGLRGAVLAPGETRTVPYVPDPFERRLRHVPARWEELTVSRAAAATTVETPAGPFAGCLYELRGSDGRTGTVAIEEEWPHRVLGWEWRRGEELLDSARLTGSRRMKYWELHAEGQEGLRAELGLDG